MIVVKSHFHIRCHVSSTGFDLFCDTYEEYRTNKFDRFKYNVTLYFVRFNCTLSPIKKSNYLEYLKEALQVKDECFSLLKFLEDFYKMFEINQNRYFGHNKIVSYKH